MKKILSLLAVSAILPFCASAETLTPQEALQRASRSNIARAASKVTKSMDLVFTQNTLTDSPAVYVFQSPKSEGYLFVAADDVAIPVLGYADSGSFDAEDMAPGLQAWLQEYARQIQYAVTMGVAPASYDKLSMGDPIAPLIKTKWNQSNPYNLKTPEVNGQHCVTGCVATAMAQVMKYWEYPAVGHGMVTARVNNVQQDAIDLSTIPFDWKNMLDEYNANSTDAQKNAVADLMLACGFSVDMGYTLNESGAISRNLVNALVNNFDYNKNIRMLDRAYYSGSEWNHIVYEELKAKRPVLYAGQSLTGAHQYVVDGYSSDGYFHLNWGWGGMSDGYFSLDALNPDSQGIGGSSGGYNYGQSIIQGVQIEETAADESQEVIMQLYSGGIKAGVVGLRMTITSAAGAWLGNMSNETIKGSLGLTIQGVTDTSYENKIPNIHSTNLEPGYGWNSWTCNAMFPASAPNGKYKVTLAYVKENGVYVPILSPGPNYFYITKTGNKLSVENPALNSVLTVTPEIQKTLYSSGLNTFKFTAKNETDHEITQGVYPALYDKSGTMIYNAEGFMLTLQPGEEVTREFTEELLLYNGATGIGAATSETYTFKYFDPITWSPYPGVGTEVTLLNENGEKNLSCTQPELIGAIPRDFYDVNNNPVPGYTVTDPANLEFKVTFKNIGEARFAYPMTVAIFSDEDVFTGTPSPANVILQPGESTTIQSKVNFDRYQANTVYSLRPLFYFDNAWLYPEKVGASVYAYFVVSTSGVADVFTEGESVLSISYDKVSGMIEVSSDAEISSVRVFGIDGKELGISPEYAGNNASVSVADMQKGIYVILAKDSKRRNKALKIAR